MTRREYCKQKGIIVFLPDMDEEVDDDFLNFLDAVEYHTLIHQEKKELKKCPFCGGEVFVPMDFSEWSTVVVCKKCHANSGYYDTTEEAIEAWNTRADVPDTNVGKIRAKAIDEFAEKIIAVPFGDPQYNGYNDISELPAHIFDELRHFLSVYKQLEQKKVEVLETGNHEEAIQTIPNAMEKYEKDILECK